MALEAEQSQPGTLSFEKGSELSPLNAFFQFPENVRPQVLEALELATTTLPTTSEHHAARKRGGRALMAIEDQYGNAADDFARKIDPKFKPEEPGKANERTLDLRGEFYKMIRTLSRGQIARGLERLES